MAGAVLTTALMSAAPADVVRLKNGTRLEGKVAERPGEIEVETADGARVTVSRSQVQRIEKRALPRDLYQQRAARVGANDTQGRYELGLWCLQNGLAADATAAFRRVIELNPEHADARAALGYERVGNAWIKGKWETLESDHFLIYYNTPITLVQGSSRALEAFHAAFVRSFCPPLRLQGSRKIPLKLFNRRVAYLDHIQEVFPQIAGKADTLDKIPRAFTETVTRMILGYIESGESEALLDVVLLHETTHALMAMAREKSMETPRWFEESFADYLACSTVGNGAVLLGQGVRESFLFRGRMAEAREAVQEGKHVPLKDLLGKTDFDIGDDRMGLMYAESFSVLYYLVTQESANRPEAFREYLVAVSQGQVGIEPLERVFGVKVDALEPKWAAFMKEFKFESAVKSPDSSRRTHPP